jgi:hypothetical protein
MSDFSCVEDVKREAEAILQTLRDLNPDTNVTLGHCYELIARRKGYSCWRAYKKELEKEIKEQLPSPVRAPILTQEEVKRFCEDQEPTLPELTIDDYTLAVETLLEATTMSGTSGAKASALVLLSLYNAYEWHFDLTELCVLDFRLYDAAINAIRGRIELMIEPNSLIEDGSERFRKLWDQWSRYRISNAWKRSCTKCSGYGNLFNDDGELTGPCPSCDGRGYEDPITDTYKELEVIIKKIENLPDAPRSDLKSSLQWIMWGNLEPYKDKSK